MPVVGEKDPSCQVKRVQCPRSLKHPTLIPQSELFFLLTGPPSVPLSSPLGPSPRSVEGSRQQGEVRLGEFLSPPEQAHDNKEISIGKKRTPEFRHRARIRHDGDNGYGKDADSPRRAVRATCLLWRTSRRCWEIPSGLRRSTTLPGAESREMELEKAMKLTW